MAVRPDSIRQFEYFYLGSIALAVVNLILTYSQVNGALSSARAFDAPAAVANVASAFMVGSLLIGILFALIIPLTLWYFAARRASQTARWIAVVLGALSAIRLLVLIVVLGWLIVSRAPVVQWMWYNMLIGIVSETLHMAAIYFLFPADAREWFSRGHSTARHQDIFS
ncbi:MAG TPA: hypothetical protein VGB54_12095 [Allosphingosinicella sp.]